MNKSKTQGLLLLAVLVGASAAPAQNALEDKSLLKSLNDIGNYYRSVQDKLGTNRSSTPGAGATDALGNPLPAPQGSTVPSSGGVVLDPADRIPQRPIRDSVDEAFRSLTLDRNRDGYRQGRRNPFAPTGRIISSVKNGGGSAANLALQPIQKASSIPRMHLRGLVSDESGQAALLEIGGAGVYLVREGDTVGLYETGSNAVVRVREINRLNMVVEAGSLGQLFIVR